MIENREAGHARQIFHNLGNNKQLFSFQSRVFVLIVHSEESINLTIKEAFKENIDFVANKLLIRKFGKLVESSEAGKKTQVKLLHRHSYGVYNHTDKYITATLDLRNRKT